MVTPNKRLGSGPISDYRAAMAETRAGRGMFFGEARTLHPAGVVHCNVRDRPMTCQSHYYVSH